MPLNIWKAHRGVSASGRDAIVRALCSAVAHLVFVCLAGASILIAFMYVQPDAIFILFAMLVLAGGATTTVYKLSNYILCSRVPVVACPHCKVTVSLIGRFPCDCGVTTNVRHVLCGCRSCGAEFRWIECGACKHLVPLNETVPTLVVTNPTSYLFELIALFLCAEQLFLACLAVNPEHPACTALFCGLAVVALVAARRFAARARRDSN